MRKYTMFVGKWLLLFIGVSVLTLVNSIFASIYNYFGVTYTQYGALIFFLSLAIFILFNLSIGVLLCFLLHKLPFFRICYRVLPRKQIFGAIFGLALGFFAIDARIINLPYWIGRFSPNAMSCLYCIGVFIGYELFSMFAVKRAQSQIKQQNHRVS